MPTPGPDAREDESVRPERPRDQNSPLPPAVAAALDEAGEDFARELERLRERTPERSRYTVLGELGSGATSRVLRVWDESLHRELAMKVLSTGTELSAEERERRERRFLEEARITGQLDHPGIVPVHDIRVDRAGTLSFTMPLVRGRTLDEVFELARAGREGWTLHACAEVLQRVCLTVAFAHSRGVVHRDLKPSNIMVGPYGEALVLDWGLSRLREHGGSSRVAGTPAYMAPERFTHPEAVDPRADVYALGAILYELLGGEVPHGRSLEERSGDGDVSTILRRPPRDVAELAPTAPPELVAICRKAMAERPEDRYATARELASDLRAWLEHRVVAAAPAGRWVRLRKWRERNRGLSRAIEALVLLALVATTAISLQQRGRIRVVQAKNRAIEEGTYAANLHSANLHLRNLEVNDARLRLAQCPPRLRSFEWGLLDYLSDSSDRILEPVEATVLAVAANQDSRYLVTGAIDGALRFYDQSGRERAGSQRLGGAIHTLRFLPGTDLFLAGTRDAGVSLWNAATAKRVRLLTVGPEPILSLAVSPGGDLVALGLPSGETRVQRTADDSVAASLPSADGPVSALAFAGGGRALAVGHSSGYVALWRVDPARRDQRVLVASAPIRRLLADDASAAVLAAVGTEVLRLSGSSLAVEQRTAGHSGAVMSLDLDGHGHVLTASSDGTIRLFDEASGAELQRLSGHLDGVDEAVFLDGGLRVLSGSEDRSARLWSLRARPVTLLEGHEDWVTSLSFSPDGARLASTSRDQTLRLWDPEDGRALEVIALGSASDAVAWRDTETLILEGSAGTPTLLHPHDDRPAESYPSGHGSPTSLAYSRPADTILATYADGHALLFRLPDREPALDVTVPGEVFASALAPAADWFAVGDLEGNVTLFEAERGTPARSLRGADSGITLIAFDHGGRLLAACTEARRILLWRLEDGALQGVLEGHENQLTALAFSPDDRRLVSGSADATLRIWNPETREALLTLRGHGGEVTSVAFSPDASRVASSSKDGTIRIWRTRPARP